MHNEQHSRLSLADAMMIWRGRDAYVWAQQWRTLKLGLALVMSTYAARPWVSEGRRGLAALVFVGSLLALGVGCWGIRKGLAALVRWAIQARPGRG